MDSANPIELLNRTIAQINDKGNGLDSLFKGVQIIITTINKKLAEGGLSDFDGDTFKNSKKNVTNAFKGLQGFFKSYNDIVNDKKSSEVGVKEGLNTILNKFNLNPIKIDQNTTKSFKELYGNINTLLESVMLSDENKKTLEDYLGDNFKGGSGTQFGDTKKMITSAFSAISSFFNTIQNIMSGKEKIVNDETIIVGSFITTADNFNNAVGKFSTSVENIKKSITTLYSSIDIIVEAIMDLSPESWSIYFDKETIQVENEEKTLPSEFAKKQTLICNAIKLIQKFFEKISIGIESLKKASDDVDTVLKGMDPKNIINTLETLYGTIFNITDTIMNPDNIGLWEDFFKDNYRNKLDKNDNSILTDEVTQQEKYSIFGDKQKIIIGAITGITKFFAVISKQLNKMSDEILKLYQIVGKILDPTIIINIVMEWIQKIYLVIMKYNMDLIELNERIQSLQGIFTGLVAIFDIIEKLKIIPVSLMASIISIQILGVLIEEIDRQIQEFKNADYSKAITQITQLVEIFRGISAIYQALNSISLTTLLLALLKMNLINSMFSFSSQNGYAGELGGFFTILDSINKISIMSALLIGKKIEILTKSEKLIAEFINTIQSDFDQFDVKALEQINYKLTLIGVIFNSYLDLLDIFVKIKIKGYLKILGKIDTAPLTEVIFKLANEIINLFSELDKKKLSKSHKNIELLLGIFKSFKAIMITLMLLVPIGLLFIMMSPLIIIMVVITAFILNLIFKVLNVILSAKLTVSTFTKIIGIIAGLILVAAALILLGLLAPLALRAFIPALALLGAVVTILVITALIGLVVSLAGPLLLAGALGILTAAFIIFLLLAIVAMVYLIGEITLDVDKIMKNVQAILGIVFRIFDLMLDPDGADTNLDLLKNGKDKNEQSISGSEDAWWVIAGKFIGGIISKIAGAIVSVVVLLFAVIAVASILLIASMLRLLQELNLDPGKIAKNVAMVMRTCDQIINSIFVPSDPTENVNNPSKGSDVGNIAGWICEHVPGVNMLVGIMEIINSLLAFGYLVVMVFAILSITLIASMLRLIQELDLNPTKIIENVNAVMWTCDQIINSIFTPSDPTEDVNSPSKGSDVGNIIGWICEHVPGVNMLVGIMQIVNSLLAFGYLVIMTFAILSITLIASMLRLIQELDLNPKKIEDNVNTVMSTCHNIISSIFPNDDNNPESGSSNLNVFGSLVSFIYPPLGPVIESIFAFVYLALLTVSILMIMLLAKLLTSLVNDYKLEDIILAGMLGTEILKAAKDIQRAVFFGDRKSAEGNKSSGSIGQKVWDALDAFFTNIPGVKLLSALMALGNVAHMAMGILLIMTLGRLLSQLARINIPNIKNLGRFSRDIVAAAKEAARAAFNLKFDLPENAEEIANQMFINSILSGISRLIPGLSADLGSIKNIPSVGIIIGGIGSIKAVGIALMSLESISINVEDVRNKLQNINTAIPFLCESLTIIDSYQPDVNRVNKNLNLIKKLHEIIPGLTHVTAQDVKNSKDLTDNYIAFLTKVNSMDYTKLKTTEQLMKHWADMSRTINGNFQGLAQAINEHIMPALNNLNKTMDESMKVQKQIIDDLSKPIDASRMVSDTPGVPSITPSDSGQNGAPSNTSSPDGDSSSSSYSGTDYISTGESAYGNTVNDFDSETEKEPIGDGPSFINPYVRNTDKQRKSALERLTKALDGDALRVKIIN